MNTSWKTLSCDFVLAGLVTLVLAADKPAKNVAPKPSDAQIPNPQTKPSGPANSSVIGYIEKRDRTITIKSSPKGTLYSVKSADGKVLFEDLSAEQLHAKAPDLDEFIKSAVAGNTGPASDGRLRMKKMDASLSGSR